MGTVILIALIAHLLSVNGALILNICNVYRIIASFAVFSLLDDLGGYLPPDSTGTVNLGALIARILRVNGAPLFDLYIDRDLQNNSRLAIFLDLPRRYEHNIRLLRHPLDFEQVRWGRRQNTRSCKPQYLFEFGTF